MSYDIRKMKVGLSEFFGLVGFVFLFFLLFSSVSFFSSESKQLCCILEAYFVMLFVLLELSALQLSEEL